MQLLEMMKRKKELKKVQVPLNSLVLIVNQLRSLNTQTEISIISQALRLMSKN